MSRGFGWVQLAAIAYLYEHRFAFTHELARAVFIDATYNGTAKPTIVNGRIGFKLAPSPRHPSLTESDIRSLLRALRRLRQQGLVASCGKMELLWTMPRGVPERMGWEPRGPGVDIRSGFDPKNQRKRRA
jgi:hypothetical protein